MRSSTFAEMFRGLSEEEVEAAPRRWFHLFRIAGAFALAAFALTACGDDNPFDDLDDTRTATATGTGPDTATATATGGPTDTNTQTSTVVN